MVPVKSSAPDSFWAGCPDVYRCTSNYVLLVFRCSQQGNVYRLQLIATYCTIINMVCVVNSSPEVGWHSCLCMWTTCFSPLTLCALSSCLIRTPFKTTDYSYQMCMYNNLEIINEIHWQMPGTSKNCTIIANIYSGNHSRVASTLC